MRILNTPNSDFQILNVYAPNIVSDWKAFFDMFWQYMFQNVPLIVGRNFNCVPCVLRDKFGGAFGNKGVTELHSFTDSNSLIDIYCAKFPNTPQYTWVNGPHPHNRLPTGSVLRAAVMEKSSFQCDS